MNASCRRFRQSAGAGIRVATAILTAAIGGCTQTPVPLRAEIHGANDLALVGSFLFVTATDDNELRVIDLAPTAQDFVRAPNPLHALSIPVVDRPVALARDVVWDADAGVSSGGSYVYALSASSPQLSIIDADSADADSLKALATWSAATGKMLTTAAARRDSTGGPSTLFVATFDGFDAEILSQSVPSPEQLSAVPVLSPSTAILQLPCASITSLLVLPKNGLAWSARPAPCRDSSTPAPPPRAEIIDQNGTSTPLKFPDGIAVRKLVTHDQFADASEATHGAAERIFGVLDERSCGGGAACRGIFAVVGPGANPLPVGPDCGGAVGEPACDFSGARMLPIANGRSLIMDAAIISGASPALPSSATQAPPTSLIGVFTTSDGQMVFFDAQRLRHFDVNPQVPTLLSFTVRAPDGLLLTAESGPILETVELADGAARSEIISFTFLGDLPGFSNIAAPQTPATQIPPGAIDPAGVVEVGDRAYAEGTQEGGAGCAGSPTALVTAIGPPSISIDAPLGGPACIISIRPPDDTATPWVVAGSSSGYLGRIAASTDATDVRQLPADVARRRALYFNRPIGFVDTTPVTTPYLKLAFLTPSSLPADPSARRGFRVALVTDGGYHRGETLVDPNDAAARGVLPPDVAGAIAFRPGTEQLFVAYPSPDAVLRFELGSVPAGAVARLFQPFH
jgi:hypothetical protein